MFVRHNAICCTLHRSEYNVSIAFFFWLCSMWDLSSPAMDGTHTPCVEAVSSPLTTREVPNIAFICAGKPKTSCDFLYCNIRFTMIAWMEEEMSTRSSVLAWRIPWTEEPGGLQFRGSQRVRRD